MDSLATEPSIVAWKHARKQFHDDFLKLITEDTEGQQMLANYRTDREPFVAYIQKFATQWDGLYQDWTNDQLVQVVTHGIGREIEEGEISPLAAALSCFKIRRFCEQNAKRNFLQENEMTKAYRDDPDRIYRTDAVQVIHLPWIKSAYPPRGKWICESQEIHDLWHYHLHYGPKADKRLPRHEPIIIDKHKLKKIIDADTSCIVKDAETEEIVLVILRSCFSCDIGEWLDEIIEEATSTRQNIRRDDEGILVMIGLSAGARSKPAFHWARNLLRKFDQDQVSDFDKKQCSAFAFFWNWLRCHLPKPIIEDFDYWMDTAMLPRMTPKWQELSRQGSYTVDLPGYKPLHFTSVKLAPPAGVMASNYARPMHCEHQPHKYAVAFTARRNAETTDGGHFYIGNYGIKVEASANSIVAWQPKDIHGTSLQNRHPYDTDPDFIQRGMAIVTSSRLTRAWEKYALQLGADLNVITREAKKAEDEIYWSSKEIDEKFK